MDEHLDPGASRARGARALPPRLPHAFALAALAVVAASLATIGASRALSPGAARRALLTRSDGETLAGTTEACRVALLREEARRARAGGYGALAIPVRLPPAGADPSRPPRLPPEATARKLVRAGELLAVEGLRAIPLVEPPAGEDCRSRRVVSFVERWRREAADSGRAASAQGAAAHDARPSHAGAADVLCRDEGSPIAVFDGGPGDGLPEAIVAETGLPDVENGDFRRGWDGWRTRGRVSLEPPGEPIAEACFPLVARLDRGGAIAQVIAGGLPDLARDVPGERPAEDESSPEAELVLEVVPEPSPRSLVVAIAGSERVVSLAAGESRTSVPLASRPEAGDELSIEVPPEGRGSIALASVRLRPIRAEADGRRRTRVEPAPWQVVSVASIRGRDPARARASIDLSSTGDLGPVAFSPDEMNAWKMYVYFGRDALPPGLDRSPGWLRRTLPWVTHLRFPAALGGNFCDRAPRPCRTFDRTSARPSEIDCFDAPPRCPPRTRSCARKAARSASTSRPGAARSTRSSGAGCGRT